MRAHQIGNLGPAAGSSGGPVMEEIERVDMNQVEAGDIAEQRAAQRPGSEPEARRLQRKMAQLDPVADNRRAAGRDGALLLDEVGRVDRQAMAAAGDGARHLEAGLGRPAADRRKIADDVEDFHR